MTKDLEMQSQIDLIQVFDHFLDPRGFFRENVSEDAEANDSFEGCIYGVDL